MSIYTKNMPQIQLDGFALWFLLLAVAISMANMVLNVNNPDIYSKMMIITLFNLLGVVVVAFNKRVDKEITFQELNHIFTALIVGLVCIYASAMIIPVVFQFSTLDNAIYNILFMVAIATGEELFFRYFLFMFGYMLSGNIFIAAIMQASIFALFHVASYSAMGLTVNALIVAFIAGIIFLWQDIYTKRLSTSMITHIMWNTLPIIMGLLI